MAMKITN